MTTFGIVVFDGVEELDAVGPWEVLTSACLGSDSHDVVTVSLQRREVACAKGMHWIADHTVEDCPSLDVIVVPGGMAAFGLAEDAAAADAVGRLAETCSWITSVCNGTFLLQAAGLVTAKQVTTHWAAVEALRLRHDGDVLEGVRYVVDGNVVTSAGVSAGIDMALWLTGQIFSPEHARNTQRMIEYDPAPPYADVAASM